jgi:predicted GTPase
VIVLDEQLLGRGIEREIAAWYSGSVCFITDLRPGTIIKDDAIPMLLAQENQPIFVTINVIDFWQRIAMQSSICVVCISVPDTQATQVSLLLRRLLGCEGFQTKGEREGKVIRLTSTQAQYYTARNSTVQTIATY